MVGGRADGRAGRRAGRPGGGGAGRESSHLDVFEYDEGGPGAPRPRAIHLARRDPRAALHEQHGDAAALLVPGAHGQREEV